MKKLGKILAGICGVLYLAAAVGCAAKKEPVTAAEFSRRMEQEGYSILDATEQFEGQVVSATLAVEQSGAYQIEFFEVETEQQAKIAFEQNKAAFESESGPASSRYENNGLNFGVYAQTSNGKYSYVCRVGQTFVYANVPEQNKDAVKSAIKGLGY